MININYIYNAFYEKIIKTPVAISFFSGMLLVMNCNSVHSIKNETIVYTANKTARILFYNVENLFDTIDDPRKKDNEFLPGSKLQWTSERYRQKLIKISKVLLADGAPALVGLSEIENRSVLEDMVNKTPLTKFNYKIIHEESPDARGIDVALLYKEEAFSYLAHTAIPVNFPFAPSLSSRDILYVKGVLFQTDTIHLFVNHWPSRLGGTAKSENKRITAANCLREKTDSLFRLDQNSKIIIMGDFNDEPNNTSMENILRAGSEKMLSDAALFFNPYYMIYKKGNTGSTQYKNRWNLIDQIILSPALLDTTSSLYYIPGSAGIFQAEWLFTEDYKIYRTYQGPVYKGGFSDHLPVYIDIGLREREVPKHQE